MARNRLPPSVNPSEESESEKEEDDDEEGVEEEEQVVADEVNRKEAGSDEEEEEEDLSAKTTSQEKEPKKRLAESDASRDKSQVKKAKREKKKKGNVAEKDVALEDKSKRSAGRQMIWGAEDEMKILTGILEYKQGTGLDYNSNLKAFYEYIKGSLNAVVDKNQLKNKIRKLKEKCHDNAMKEANGKAPVFSKGHEAEAYEHSKKIWGGKSVSQGAKSKPKPKTEVSEKWTKYQLELAQLYAKKLDLVMEHTKLILDALKTNP